MKRNESMLEFQRRLIRVAMRSPRTEAMNMLGIVWSNLKEFVEVRIPLDDDREDLLSQFFETLELFDSAIERKFPNLYMANNLDDIENIQNALHIGDPARRITPTAKKHIIEYGKAIFGFDDVNGIIVDGQFYHRNTVLNAINPFMSKFAYMCKYEHWANRWERHNHLAKNKPYTVSFLDTIVADSGRISAPKSSNDNENEQIERITNWIQSRKAGFKGISAVIHFRPTTDSDAPKFSYNANSVSPYGHNDKCIEITVIYKNPLFLDFNKTAKIILEDAAAKNINTSGLKYESGVNPVSQTRGCVISNPDQILMRTPLDTSYIYECLFDRLGFDKHKEFTEADTIGALSKLACDLRNEVNNRILRRCFMTVYRTGKSIDDLNYRFIVLMAMTLRDQAMIMIECRARGDEENNLKLMHYLASLGANVHIMSNSGWHTKKVHAKIWDFEFERTKDDVKKYESVQLYSTGNFVKSAQEGFSDTINIVTEESHTIDGFRTYELWNDLFGFRSVNEVHGNQLIWRPKMIRNELIRLIQITRLRAMANGVDPYTGYEPFIWIKVNHLTDPDIIRELRKAARAGVSIRIIARTTCVISSDTLPKNFEIRSIAGKYLEHDRWFIFGEHSINPVDQAETYIRDIAFMSSCDLMERNLDNRIEFIKRLDGDTGMAVMNYFDTLFNSESDPENGFFNFKI